MFWDGNSQSDAQVQYALRDLEQDDLDKIMAALEVLARLGWSDDEVCPMSMLCTLQHTAILADTLTAYLK